MIKSFKNKGLEKFFNDGIVDDIDGADANRLRYALSIVDAADELRDLNIPSLKFTKENNKGFYSICVGNGKKIVFRLVPNDNKE